MTRLRRVRARSAVLGLAALAAVDVGNMDFDVRNPILEPGEALAYLLFEAGVAVIVAGNLIVGTNLDEHRYSPSLPFL